MEQRQNGWSQRGARLSPHHAVCSSSCSSHSWRETRFYRMTSKLFAEPLGYLYPLRRAAKVLTLPIPASVRRSGTRSFCTALYAQSPFGVVTPRSHPCRAELHHSSQSLIALQEQKTPVSLLAAILSSASLHHKKVTEKASCFDKERQSSQVRLACEKRGLFLLSYAATRPQRERPLCLCLFILAC